VPGPSGLLVSVVIPTFDRPDALARCLDHLARQTLPTDRFEVIVVDDASVHPVRPLLEAAYANGPLQVVWERVEPNNPARARNAGIDAARGWLILFMGDDILALPHMLEEHVRLHEQNPDNIGVVGRIETDPELVETAFDRFFDSFGFTTLSGDQQVTSRYFQTNNVSLKTDYLRRHGRFDEDFPDANHEDIELGYRLEQGGLRLLYRDRLLAYHRHVYTLAAACRLAYRRGATYWILRDKVPDAVFRENLGIFSWRNRPQSVAKSLVRSVLVNDLTARWWLAWLSVDRESRLRRFFYWKLLGYHQDKGFRDSRPKPVRRVGGPAGAHP
jgi:glycosyltransferase involved in cell wall biosynthesis